MTSIMAKFMWIIARVDSRQYRQNSTELQPERFWVGVEVPLETEYVFNATEILKAQLGSGNMDVPTPIYTAKALQFCLDNLGEYLRDPDDVKAEDLKPDDDWSDKPTEPTKVENDDEIDWSDDTEKSPQTKEVKEIWDDNDGDPDEKWDDTKEDWSEQ